jgi:prepilin-type processing-associated H-X9-DG protein
MLETFSSAGLANSTETDYFRFSHNGNTKMNVLYIDGHVASVTPQQILPGSSNAEDTTKWPSGYSAFWFGQNNATQQILIDSPP